jgi:hypothetical protein
VNHRVVSLAVGVALALLTAMPLIASADDEDDKNDVPLSQSTSVKATPGGVSEGLVPLGQVNFTP